ncbi:MAG: phage tail family protein [Ruminococcus sp.]|nr:phage tail family protein [Candidatus Copronaster equi]
MDNLTFNEVSANSLNFFVKSHDLVYAEKDIELEEVPGKSGAIIHDYKKYKNVISPYVIGYYGNNLLTDIDRLIESWFINSDYQELSDTYDTKIRYGVLTGQLEFVHQMMKYGEATLNFDCKPFRYSSNSKTEIITSGTKSFTYNGTVQATPEITISRSGNTVKFSVNSKIYQFSNLPTDYNSIIIDSEKEQIYKLVSGVRTNLIKYADFDEFPTLQPGTNSIYIYSDSDINFISLKYRETFV